MRTYPPQGCSRRIISLLNDFLFKYNSDVGNWRPSWTIGRLQMPSCKLRIKTVCQHIIWVFILLVIILDGLFNVSNGKHNFLNPRKTAIQHLNIFVTVKSAQTRAISIYRYFNGNFQKLECRPIAIIFMWRRENIYFNMTHFSKYLWEAWFYSN